MKKYLIIDSDKKYWPKDGQNIFFSKACFFDSNDYCDSSNNEFIKEYGIDINQRKKDKNYLDKLNEILIDQLSQNLNYFHKVNFSKKYWRIIIGPWIN